jgi:DNA repair protein RecN (Recombination protein N)
VDAGAEELVQLHEQTVASLRELQSALSHYADKVDVDPQRLQQLEERLNLIQSLKRKYGGSVADILVFGDEARRKLESLEERDAELSRINAEIQKVEENLLCAGRELSAKRRKVIPRLSKAVSQQLGDLGFAQSRFDVSLTSSEHPLTPSLSPNGGEGVRRTGEGVLGNKESSFNSAGFDQIEFQFAPNPGEASRPLRAIASSGEMARVMLAIKTVLAAEDEIPVLIFDEVDANIGGETANVVGEKMRQLAKRRQVLCITHLPQVAAPASAHYVVTKQVKGGRTVSEINLINGKERVTELARMLGGQTDAARKHAEAMLK